MGAHPHGRQAMAAVERLGRERVVAFLRAVRGTTDCLAVELANEALDEGTSLHDLFKWDRVNGTGYHLSTRRMDPGRVWIRFGCIAGPMAADGGTWTVTFNADGSVRHVEPGEYYIS